MMHKCRCDARRVCVYVYVFMCMCMCLYLSIIYSGKQGKFICERTD